MATLNDLVAAEADIKRLEAGLRLAVRLLTPHEPSDSRAVSNEFVALAALSSGDTSDDVMTVIEAANANAVG